jgi:DNA repair protein RecO (recombination protein O)
MDSSPSDRTERQRDRIIRCECIVLRRLDYSETDRILTILTDRFGKMRVIAKGIRKPSARLAAHLELFSESRIVLSRGRDLDVVTGAETINLHVGLRDNLSALGAASHCVELVDRFLADRDENRVVYRNLVQTLRELDEGGNPNRISRAFEFQLLEQMGVRPELFDCVVCGRAVEAEPNRFSLRGGGVLCREHASSDFGSPELSLAAQKMLRLLARGGRGEFMRVPLPESVANEIELVLGLFVKHQLERDLLSQKVSRRVAESLPDPWDHTSTK